MAHQHHLFDTTRAAERRARARAGGASILLLIGGLMSISLGCRDSSGNSTAEGTSRVSQDNDSPFAFAPSTTKQGKFPTHIQKHGNLTLHWGELSPLVKSDLVETSLVSNIHKQDYVGAEACKRCHAENYENWSRHPHRFMNALASAGTVKGDFSGAGKISYQGADGEFKIVDGKHRMTIHRDGKTHVYEIAKTLGSRFFQYYIGRGIEGPPPEGHDYYAREQVLPFGYWIDRKMWVPIVHVVDELPDEGGRWNPLSPPPEINGKQASLVYSEKCSVCHTTYPLGESMVRHPDFRGKLLPFDVHLSVDRFTQHSHPEIWDGSRPTHEVSQAELGSIIEEYHGFQHPDQAATLGISCEACHLGSRAHAEGKLKKPSFRPHAEAVMTRPSDAPEATGPTHANVNWACSRCHVGARPAYASGVSTWNSVEFSDAMRGSCYSQLTCIDCHEPHTAIGPRWDRPAAADDAVCMKCHQEYEQPEIRSQHTHHPAGSSGDRCFNCHMPRINEGLQDAVRTHMIYSPNREDMIHAGQPNACNLCHLDENIDWTVKHLESWYGSKFDAQKIEQAHRVPREKMGVHYLQHAHEGTRLVAVDALGKADARWALAEMIEMLDDEFLLNRQFAQKAIEDMLGIQLSDQGYVFYMTAEERAGPLGDVRRVLLSDDPGVAAAERAGD